TTDVSVAVALVPGEHDHVAGLQDEGATSHRELDATPLASQVLASAGGMRDPGHAGAGRELEPLDVEAAQLLGQQLADRDLAAAVDGQLLGPVEAAGPARSGEQLLEPDVESGSDLEQHGEGRVGGARLDVGPGR